MEKNMKPLSLLVTLALAFVLTAPAKAQEASGAAASINNLITQIGQTSDKIKDIDENQYPTLAKRKENLDSTTDLLRGAITNLKAKDAVLDQDFAANDAAVAQHNANQCVEKNHDGSCSAYTAEANRLNARTAELKQEETDLNQYRQGLKARVDQLSQDTLEWAANMKKLGGEREDLVTRGKSLLQDLGDTAAQYGVCIERYPHDSDEELKHHCGNVQFDGVRETIGKLSQYKHGTNFFGTTPQ